MPFPTEFSKDFSNNLALRTAVQLIPTLGGIIDMALTSKWQDYIQKRQDLFNEAIIQEFQDLDETKIDREYLESEEFMDLFAKTLNLVLQTRSKEKIGIYVKILKGSLLIKDELFKPEDYLNILEELTEAEMSFAKQFYDLKMEYKDSRHLTDEEKNDIDYASTHFINVSTEQAQYYFKKIEKAGLLSEKTGSFIGYGGGEYNLTEIYKSLMSYISRC